MFYDMDSVLTLNLIFIIATSVLVFLIYVLTTRNYALRKKIKNLSHELSLKDQELTKKAIDVKAILKSDMEKSKSIVISVDKNHIITYTNEYALHFFGYSKSELVGANIFDTIYPKNNAHISFEENMIDRIFANPQLYIEHESENTTKSGKKIWISWTNRIIYDENNQPQQVRSVGFDISQRKSLETTLNIMSSLDDSTHLLNRQTFLSKGSTELKRANEFKHPISLILIKLDCFYTTKKENVRFTDELLIKIVHILQKSIKDTDILARLDHQEFAIILPETAYENASFLAEKLKEKIKEFNLSDKKDDIDLFINANIAVSYKQNKQETIDSLLQKALDKINSK